MKRAGTITERLANIEALILDVDGVLTDGSVVYTDQGAEIRRFHVRDGSALVWWHSLGHACAIVSGRDSPIVERRAKELGIGIVMQGISDKKAALMQLCATLRIEPRQCAGIGDDLPDLPMLEACGVGVAVADACRELRSAADHVTAAPGGHGAVREAVEWILKAQGRWETIVSRYKNGVSA